MSAPDPDLPPLLRVRAEDHDRYLTLLYAPAPARPALAVLYALNLEWGRIREQISEPMLAEIRLTWWREALEGAYAGQPRAHPLIRSAAEQLPVRGLRLGRLEALIDARIADLGTDRLRTVADVTNHVDATSGGLCAAAMVLCAGDEVDDDTLARAAGRAWGLTGLIRAVGFHAALQRHYLPEAALEAAGIAPETLYRGEIGPQLAPVLRQLAERARADIAAVRAGWLEVPAARRAPLLLARLAEGYLDRLKRIDFDLSRFEPGGGGVRRQLALLKVALTGRL